MGCDIHGWAEKQVDGKWVQINPDILNYRSYRSFAVMAGVRNYFEPADSLTPISEARGWPSDSPEATNSDDENSHSHSWLLLSEILEYPHWDKVLIERGDEDTIRNHASCLWKDVEKLLALNIEPSKVRIIFAFDN